MAEFLVRVTFQKKKKNTGDGITMDKRIEYR